MAVYRQYQLMTRYTFVLALLFLLIMLFAEQPAQATGQAADKLIIEGKEHMLFTNPLEPYFSLHPDKRPKSGGSTSLWRAYIATFEIREGLLYILDVETRFHNLEINDLQLVSVYDSIFGSEKNVVADWFEGLLVIPTGQQLQHISMGYASIYEQYLLLQIVKGHLQKGRVMGSDEYLRFKKKQFEEYKKSPEFQAEMRSLDKSGHGDRTSDEQFIYLFETEYTSKYLLDF